MDHATDFTYAHLMRELTLEETLLAKKAFEKLVAQRGKSVKRYHADNGRYADKGFLEDINSKDQTITFCGVGAHHQNGIVERRIRLITEISRTLLLHAQRHWPEYITTMLWPFAVKAAVDRLNNLTMDLNGQTPASRFYGTEKGVDVKEYHPFGCPVFVLDAALQSGQIGPPKWEPRSRVGIYLGRSPMHAGSVSLVLNPQTGHVSPQYHVVFDDTFGTVEHMRNGSVPPTWEQMCKNSTELATEEVFDLAETWYNDITQMHSEKINDPYQVISDQSRLDGRHSLEEAALNFNRITDREGVRSSLRGLQDNTKDINNMKNNDSSDYAAKRVSFKSSTEPAGTSLSRPPSGSYPTDERMKMPDMINLKESGLRRSPRIKELMDKKNAEEKHPSAMKKQSYLSKKASLALTHNPESYHFRLPRQNMNKW